LYLPEFIVSGKKMVPITRVAPMAHHTTLLRHVRARRELICDNPPSSIRYFKYFRGRLSKTKPYL
jgi:hypothetical protein